MYIFQGIVDPLIPWRKLYRYITLPILGNFDIDETKICSINNILLFLSAQGRIIHNMYKNWMDETNIEEKSDLLATHTVVRNNFKH